MERGVDHARRLDELARAVAREQISRRDALGRGAKLALGAAFTSPVWGAATADALVKKKKCKPGHARCGSSCCPPLEKCVATAKGRKSCKCLAPHKKCGSRCISVKSDPRNCGACAHACAPGQVCSVGICTTVCASGLTNCSGACVALTSDPHDCGACGHVCPSGQVCANGACTLQCAAGLVNCGGGCVNTATDTGNCGSCGHVCGSGQVCANGTCTNATCNGASSDACGVGCVNCTLLAAGGTVSGPMCVYSPGGYRCGCAGNADCAGVGDATANNSSCTTNYSTSVCTCNNGGTWPTQCCYTNGRIGCVNDADCCPGLHCIPGTPYGTCG